MENGQITTDFLVIGSGIAGLSTALKLAKIGKVLVLAKSDVMDTNTRWAQGGIAGVFDSHDNFQKHIQDTLTAGDGLCNEQIVRIVVTEGPERIKELMEMGTEFDKTPDGSLMLGKEGGHSHHRILHAHDATGFEIQKTLTSQAQNHPNITITEHFFAIDLLTQHHLGRYVNRGYQDIECYGVYALDLKTRKILTILSKVTVLATGGAGNVYLTTTNPRVATGDGVAMAYRAKARVANMEFYQFHPTALYDTSGTRPAFLITEALRGKGAILKSAYDKKPFMENYHPLASLAPRDIVARAIDNQMKISGNDFVFLDATHIPANELKQEFPTIYNYCLQKGIDITKDYIPVVPAAHYMCGGIHTDEYARTSIKRLYAVGECSCTGLHGANRLASNSLLEAIVFAERAYQDIRSTYSAYSFKTNIPPWNDENTEKTDEWILISHNFKELQNVMSNYVGIVRTNLRLQRANRRINLIHQETTDFYKKTKISPELCELRNLITIAYLIIKSAMQRKESRGLHYTLDYPNKSPEVFDTIL